MSAERGDATKPARTASMIAPSGGSFSLRIAVVVATTVALGLLLTLHAPGMNGPYYYKWAWRALPYADVLAATAPGLAIFVAAQWLHAREGFHVGVPIAAMMLAVFVTASLATSIEESRFGFDRMSRIIANPISTGYYSDAARLERSDDWLATLTERPTRLTTHSMTKPPGPIAICRFLIFLFGASAPLAIAVSLTALATLIVPATYGMSRLLGADRGCAFAAASMTALMPGPVLISPTFDQLYPPLACGMVGCWIVSLDRQRAVYAAAFGAILAIATLLAYNVLVLGALLAAYTAIWVLSQPAQLVGATTPSQRATVAAAHGLIAFGVVAAWNAGLHIASGFDPIATFRFALSNQAYLLKLVPRPWPDTVLFDLTDFAMGVAWLPVGLAVVAARRRVASDDRVARIVLLVLAELVLVATTALLPGETARVWMFLMPLVAFAAGVEVGTWRSDERLVAYGAMWLLLAVVCRNLAFSDPV